MKVKITEHPKHGKMVAFWCQGCGCFHSTLASKWNGDKDDKPSIEFRFDGNAPNMAPQGGLKCYPDVKDGVVTWSKDSTHRMAGQSAELQHEEAWRPTGAPWDAKLGPPPGVPVPAAPAPEPEAPKA
jgi:hypothetical protein